MALDFKDHTANETDDSTASEAGVAAKRKAKGTTPVRQTMYFAVKLTAPRVGDRHSIVDVTPSTMVTKHRMEPVATTVTKDRMEPVATTTTKHRMEPVATTVTKERLDDVTPEELDDRHLRIGIASGAIMFGIAGHMNASILDFSDDEDAKCRSVAEAERLVATKHKEWLADAYDWFVIPAEIG